MKVRFVSLVNLLFLMLWFSLLPAQEDVSVITSSAEAAEDLDLKAVAALFQESENLEAFEKALNDPEIGINNLDLNEDQETDFIRVVEEVEGETHLIILQVPLAENEFQDVATIAVEKTSDDAYEMHVHGDEIIYGANYYVAPAYVHIHAWPIISWMYGPLYRPYRSVFRIGFYPAWWRPYRPVSLKIYRTRSVHFVNRSTFTVRKTTRVRSVSRINYKPRSSTLVTKKTRVTRGGKTTTVTKGVKKTKNPKIRKTTVKKGSKKTVKTKAGKKTTVKKTKVTKKKKR